MSDNRGPNPIQINKYPNRRYYDTIASRHVTLQEIHDLIISGKDVVVTDTKTGEDLTNAVLMQILLERDHLKLDLFPSSIMHVVIRSNRKALRATAERFFGPFLGMMAAGQKQFDSYFRETMKGQMLGPFDWSRGMMRAFGADAAAKEAPIHEQRSQSKAASEREPDDVTQLDELRSQIEFLRQRVQGLSAQQRSKPQKKGKPGRSNRKR